MKVIETFKRLIGKAQSIVITTHTIPDADGIGSQVALCVALRELGKDAICVNDEPLLERYLYLDSKSVIISYDEYIKRENKEIDLFIVTDTNSLERIGPKVQNMVTMATNLLYIDHHPCPEEIARIHCIDTKAAATGELVGRLIESIGVSFTKEMALPLYTAILIDTSSFRYPTVSANTHLLISKLMNTGIEPPEAYNYIYGTKKVSYMQLLGTVLTSVAVSDDEKVAWLKLEESELLRYDVDPEDTHSFINHLLILDNIKVACMFRQINKKVKVSFRSAGDVDVGIMAQVFGGGGHNHSAAAMIEGDINTIIEDTIPKIQIMLDE
ncbi:MAG: bifunctional oligoribonuclease/PAP phosphatase NrnA [Bacteriovoracaceae bacterium]|jgi:bifunctional oligoribonuclease and PAP phosphatase NrnA|nr:bifunctional oligoribonuclease/PAP phosphatase NrnA [Bacteriovoracaceae bacterium]